MRCYLKVNRGKQTQRRNNRERGMIQREESKFSGKGVLVRNQRSVMIAPERGMEQSDKRFRIGRGNKSAILAKIVDFGPPPARDQDGGLVAGVFANALQFFAPSGLDDGSGSMRVAFGRRRRGKCQRAICRLLARNKVARDNVD